MRIIDADRALEIVRDQRRAHPNAYHLTNYATLILQEAPTIDPEELRPKGRWVDKGAYEPYGSLSVCVCSNCEREITIDDFDNYCPNCVAKMGVAEG